MYKAYLSFAHPMIGWSLFAGQFGDLYKDYELVQDHINEDAILQYHFIAFEKWKVSKKSAEYSNYVQRVKDKVNKMLAAGQDAKAGAYIEQYTRELRESFAIMRHLLQNKDGHFNELFAIGRPAVFYPLLIKGWKFDQTEGKTNFRRVLRLAEIFSFKVWGIGAAKNLNRAKLFISIGKRFPG
jgi:hypothetical protein